MPRKTYQRTIRKSNKPTTRKEPSEMRKERQHEDANRNPHADNDKHSRVDDDKHHYEDNDKFHVGLLFGCLVLSYLLNFAYGFQAGTTMYGVVFTIGLLVWLVVALVDYFRED